MKPSSGIRNRASQLARSALSLKPGRDVRVLPALAFARTGDLVRHLERKRVAFRRLTLSEAKRPTNPPGRELSRDVLYALAAEMRGGHESISGRKN